MYKLAIDPISKQNANWVFRLADNTCIPFNPENTDYQAYLKWLAEGNQPLPADEAQPSA